MRRVRVISALVLGLVWLSGPGWGEGTGKPAVAVIDFEPNNTSASDAAAATEFFRFTVISLNRYVVVERRKMEKILAEQAFQHTGCTSQDCAVALGKLLNAQKIIVGMYGIVGGMRFMTARLVDVATGEIDQSAKVSGFGIKEIESSTERLARALVLGEREDVRTPPAVAAEPASPRTSPAVAVEPAFPYEGDQSGDRPRLVVAPLMAQDVGVYETTYVSDVVRDVIAKTGRFGVVTRRYQESHGSGDCGTDECALKLGRQLEGRYVVTGVFGRPGDPQAPYKRLLSLRLFDVATGRQLSARVIRLKTGVDFKREVPELLSRVAP